MPSFGLFAYIDTTDRTIEISTATGENTYNYVGTATRDFINSFVSGLPGSEVFALNGADVVVSLDSNDNVNGFKYIGLNSDANISSSELVIPEAFNGLTIAGAYQLQGNVTVNAKNVTFEDLTITGDLEINGDGFESKGITVEGDTTINADAEFNTTFEGDVTVESGAAIFTDVTFENDLIVTGGSVKLAGETVVKYNLNVSGDASVSVVDDASVEGSVDGEIEYTPVIRLATTVDKGEVTVTDSVYSVSVKINGVKDQLNNPVEGELKVELVDQRSNVDTVFVNVEFDEDGNAETVLFEDVAIDFDGINEDFVYYFDVKIDGVKVGSIDVKASDLD